MVREKEPLAEERRGSGSELRKKGGIKGGWRNSQGKPLPIKKILCKMAERVLFWMKVGRGLADNERGVSVEEFLIRPNDET